MVALKVMTKNKTQRGAVLITGLLFLLVLTLVGITGTENSALELHMAANVEDEKVAFYAASAGLDSILYLEQDDEIIDIEKPLQVSNGLDQKYDPFNNLSDDVSKPLEEIGQSAHVGVSAMLKAVNTTCPRSERSTSMIFCDQYEVESVYANAMVGKSSQYQGYLKQVIDINN